MGATSLTTTRRSRTPDEIQQSLAIRRAGLRDHVAALERLVREKLDVPARIRHAIDERKQRARDLVGEALDLVRRRPVPVLIGAVFVLCGFVFLRRR
jgi:hypothetical protein